MCPVEYATICLPINPSKVCLLDTDCSGTKKCCSDGCTLECTDIKKPSQKPAPGIIISYKRNPFNFPKPKINFGINFAWIQGAYF